MAQDTSMNASTDEPRITRIFPQWFKDLDAAHKPIVSSGILLAFAAPIVVLTMLEWNKATAAREQIESLLKVGRSRALPVPAPRNSGFTNRSSKYRPGFARNVE